MEESQMDNWNDDRLDELSGRMDEGFKGMREGFVRIDQRFATKEEMKKGFSEVKGELRHLNERFDRLMHGLMVAGVSFGLSAFATVAGLLVTQV